MTTQMIALALATAVLVTLPGPNVALIVANSLRHGAAKGMVTVLGTTLGVALQLATVVLGMAALLDVAASVLAWIKWAGVVYLIWLGVMTWRSGAGGQASADAPSAVFWRAVLIAAVNPKTLLFNAAFLPQFVPADASAMAVVMVAAVYLAVILIGDIVWALCAAFARGWLGRAVRWQNRVAGGFLIGAGIGLALSRRLD